ncbi:SDR family NAD(P)-dependent oxidoreductase [Paenibacillus sp. Y412MC10]|uniref:SDR family NAD(P)-dependent oxidoreductase n=1 Tax=Geobacillus sp. (strain Y412MC10) TaxID=481743 RepID=UPI0011A8CB9E|nr:SDR family NAD(P)-dependent oxidoreductase [Paenibacillus sp. Y412MC10]
MNETHTDIENRVFLVSGGTSGVGKAIATGLARLGAKVVIISRSAESGKAALKDISEATGNSRGEWVVADLSLQSSIREVSDLIKRKYDQLHVLVNACGAIYFKKELTVEGIDRMFAVNVLSHYLLTNRLLDILQESGPARVITVSGNPRLLKNPVINFDDIQMDHQYSGMRAANQSLFARTLLSFELAKRLEGTGVTSNAFYPGFVKSNLARNTPWYLRVAAPLFNAIVKTECEIGVYLASEKEIERANGVFFDDKKQVVPIHTKFDDGAGNKLWTLCEGLRSY